MIINEKAKIALVTGGVSGIGFEISKKLIALGVSVIVADKSDSGKSIASDIGAQFRKADLSSVQETREFGIQLINEFGDIDILVNSAGYQFMDLVEDFPEEDWINMLHVMLIAPFQLTKYIVPGMKKQKWGRIVNLSSIQGLIASPYKSAYNAAKHGIIGLTKSVALETGEYGITVNALCPAYVDTPLVQNQLAAQARKHGISKEEVIQKIMLENAAIKRLVTPEEVADLALYLISESATPITGSSYVIDLGWTAA